MAISPYPLKEPHHLLPLGVPETIFSATLKFTKIKLRAYRFITLKRYRVVSAMEVLEDNVVLIERRIALWKCRCFRMWQKPFARSTLSSRVTVKACSRHPKRTLHSQEDRRYHKLAP